MKDIKRTFDDAASMHTRIKKFLRECANVAANLNETNPQKASSIHIAISAVNDNLEFAFIENRANTIEILKRLQKQTGLEL